MTEFFNAEVGNTVELAHIELYNYKIQQSFVKQSLGFRVCFVVAVSFCHTALSKIGEQICSDSSKEKL
jgi:hypothetical protein